MIKVSEKYGGGIYQILDNPCHASNVAINYYNIKNNVKIRHDAKTFIMKNFFDVILAS